MRREEGGDPRADAPQPPPPWWEQEPCRAFAAWVCARAAGPDRLQAALVAHPRTPGERLDAWAARLTDPARRGFVVEGEPLAAPAGLRQAMRSCQKPFQLWNVRRAEETHPFEMELGPELRVGGAADLPEELRVPRRIEKATAALRSWIEDAEFEAMLVRGDRRRLLQALREPLPFGKPDPRPGGGGVGSAPPRPAAGGASPFPGFPPGPPAGGFAGFGGLSFGGEPEED